MLGSQATAAPTRTEEADRGREENTEAQGALEELVELAEEGRVKDYTYSRKVEKRIVGLFRKVWPCVLRETRDCSNGRVERATAPETLGEDGGIGPADLKAVHFNGDEEGASAFREAALNLTREHLSFVNKFLPTDLKRPA